MLFVLMTPSRPMGWTEFFLDFLKIRKISFFTFMKNSKSSLNQRVSTKTKIKAVWEKKRRLLGIFFTIFQRVENFSSLLPRCAFLFSTKVSEIKISKIDHRKLSTKEIFQNWSSKVENEGNFSKWNFDCLPSSKVQNQASLIELIDWLIAFARQTAFPMGKEQDKKVKRTTKEPAFLQKKKKNSISTAHLNQQWPQTQRKKNSG